MGRTIINRKKSSKLADKKDKNKILNETEILVKKLEEIIQERIKSIQSSSEIYQLPNV